MVFSIMFSFVQRIYRLKRLYKDVEDVELMSGLWAEKYVAGGMVPHTIYCLLADQLKRSVISDRHWYESSTRPHAFTLGKLFLQSNLQLWIDKVFEL